MIKVISLGIKEFRGIRDLKLHLDGQNYAVCGPNGTGKSGIVDALEFGLTGSISRLTGKGRGSVSVREHGPHVNSRGHPERAIVTLEVVIPSTGKRATISRSIRSPRAPTIVPDEPDVRAAFAYAEQHPEFALSRREIIKYVLAEPGERAKELQALLQLDDLETVRSLLLKIANATAREVKPLEQQQASTAESLMRALGVTELKQSAVLQAVNVKRAVLGLPPLTKIEATTSIRDGLETQSLPPAVKVAKSTARDDVRAAMAALDALKTDEHVSQSIAARAALITLKSNEELLSGVARDGMLATALDLFDERLCPVCETEWDPKKFRQIVEGQRQKLIDAANQRKAAEALVAPVSARLQSAHEALAPVLTYGPNLPTPIDIAAVRELRSDLIRRLQAFRAFLPLDATIAALDVQVTEVGDARAVMEAATKAISELPEPTDRDAARDFLTVGQERLEAWRSAASRHNATKQRADVAERVHAIYSRTSDRALEAIYKDVEAEFRAFYRAINGDDESEFEAQLTPSLGKLSFEVDFYGKGFFPPGAYHSEGHQDGMGLCLYLALMKYLLGAGFTFAVLDDVLMSVDAGHRREVCSLLRSAFPGTQFVLTTHDDVWLKHMRSATLIDGKHSIEFRKWHVDHGPAEWTNADVWAEIDAYVASNDIRAAASLLRYYLEHLSAEWCSHLGGRVEYRGDARYELGDLLPAATAALRSLYKRAKAAAQSWGDSTGVTTIAQQEAGFAGAVTAAFVEQWQINPSVHYNEWENLQREDFAPVVTAFKQLERAFQCAACGDSLYVTSTGKIREALRCACAATNLNLKVKANVEVSGATGIIGQRPSPDREKAPTPNSVTTGA